MHLCIEYADPANHSDSITVRYRLRDNSMVPLWVNRMNKAFRESLIDDPYRFSGFDTLENEKQNIIKELGLCVDTINGHENIVDRKLSVVEDFDTLNYLHHIFEVYHGLLDQQTHPFFVSAPDAVKKALANLNILVHRAESIARNNKPRHVVTYYSLPKIHKLRPEHYDLFTDVFSFGTVYLNYTEIGKTLEDLAIDHDAYIGEDAFKPYKFFNADFTVLFYNSDLDLVMKKREAVRKFYLANSKFFLDKGYYPEHPHLRMGMIPLADLDSHGQELVQLLKHRQFVKSVSFE